MNVIQATSKLATAKAQARRRVTILGSTGSVGCQTIDLISRASEKYEVVALTAKQNVAKLAEQAKLLKPELAVIADESKYQKVRDALAGTAVKVFAGEDALVEVASMDNYDMMLAAIVGYAGLRPTLAAIDAGKAIALANKETLVVAGEIVMQKAYEKRVAVIPVDSEHSAIFQCLDGKPASSVRKLWLTASGGPFRSKTDWPKEKFSEITVERALKHPSWVMGRKITIDSATLFNKGLEMIEARWLFVIEMARVGVVVHPQSIVHSMVEFVDGSLIAQLSTPDMCLPIQYALTYPERAASDRVQTNFPKIGTLTFEEPDVDRFPAIDLARRAGEVGGTLPAVLNAANEIAVEAFVNRKINFPKITETVRRTMDAHKTVAHPTLDQILEADAWARREAAR